jgi:hypothetical protein
MHTITILSLWCLFTKIVFYGLGHRKKFFLWSWLIQWQPYYILHMTSSTWKNWGIQYIWRKLLKVRIHNIV